MYTAKLTREKPKLHLDGLMGGRIKVRAGEPINISIPISGAPTPRIEWTINGEKPPETNRILVSQLASLLFKINFFIHSYIILLCIYSPLLEVT